MKKLEDFKCEKIDIDSIFGGRMTYGSFSQNTVTVGAGAPADGDDGSDEDWDLPW